MSDPSQDGDMAADIERALGCTTRHELRECSDEQIRHGISTMEEMVYVIECFGVRDLVLLEWLYEEADRRGWETEGRVPHTWKIPRKDKSSRRPPR